MIFTLIKWLYAAVNIYLIVLLYRSLRGNGVIRIMRVVSCLAAILFSVAFPVSRMIEGNGLWAKGVTFAGTFWLSFILHVLLILLAFSLFRWLNRRFGPWLVIPTERLQRWRYISSGGIIGAALLISSLGWLNTQHPVAHELTLPAPANLKTPLNIVALSDTHLGRLVSSEDFSRLIDLIEPLQPDLVLFAGDIIDDHYGYDPKATRASLQRLHPRLGVWGIFGNHEYISSDQSGRIPATLPTDNRKYAIGDGAEQSLRLLEQGGIRILRDEWADLGGELLLVGRDDLSRKRFTAQERKTLPDLLASIPANLRGQPMILLDHQPFHLEEAEQAGAFLQLSGHTHNGQLFPFNWLVALIYENAYGYSQRGDTNYWVSSGAGTWGPRARTTGRPEVVLIKVEPQLTN
ncbi:metallophosphatase [Betaproteobacteria bacterium]|nr:metallophosphatase [Betaproteobacteria bacterium]GHU44034.1 metallophosphatase [Betaproteobacteria bacterium]